MRTYAPRRGAHPRDPARQATADPTACMPGTIDGHELGAGGERIAVAEAERTMSPPRAK